MTYVVALFYVSLNSIYCILVSSLLLSPSIHKRHRYDDIMMGFYGKAFDNGLQAKAAGSKPTLFPANQNLGCYGLYRS